LRVFSENFTLSTRGEIDFADLTDKVQEVVRNLMIVLI